MHYCVNNTIVTNVTKVSKVEQVTNVMYGVMCVEEKTVRKKMTAEVVLIVTRKLDLSLVTLLIIRKEKERYKYYVTFFM